MNEKKGSLDRMQGLKDEIALVIDSGAGIGEIFHGLCIPWGDSWPAKDIKT